MTGRVRTRTFTVRPEANKLFGCVRCRRKLLQGERATVTVEGDRLVSYKHAGRTCPPAYSYRPTI